MNTEATINGRTLFAVGSWDPGFRCWIIDTAFDVDDRDVTAALTREEENKLLDALESEFQRLNRE
jgi:hypothetical protein